tara:strand:- start:2196 stop:2555 length:360 start_codon:yes stop_codon:yes gene_type:complete
MIRISKKYLTKIISEEVSKVIQEEHEEHEEHDEETADPHLWHPADEGMTSFLAALAESQGLPTAQEDREGIMARVELELEDEFLDSFLAMAKRAVGLIEEERAADLRARDLAESEGGLG